MNNDKIIELLRLTALLLELHDENVFKIKGYSNAVYNLEKRSENLAELSVDDLAKIEGVGKSIATKIHEINTTGKLEDLNKLLEITPPGVINMLSIKGIGPKKIRTIWKELNIESPEQLLDACHENKISQLKGFGEKTQEAIKQSLMFAESHKHHFMYAELEAMALNLEKTISESGISKNVSLSGEIRRIMETVEVIQLIVGANDVQSVLNYLDNLPSITKTLKDSGPFVWRGIENQTGAKVEIKIYPEKKYASQLLIHSSSQEHLFTDVKDGQTIFLYALSNTFSSEEEIYTSLDMDYIVPELREGRGEIELAKQKKLPTLIKYSDLKGTLHNHSTYSDGIHTLEQMAVYCKENLGLEYLGISDHSKSAFYANGLYENRVKDQHKEIDELNKKLAPFKIFKGIESDILNDGSLDYSDDVLASFDFIVASIHSNLKMSEEKATERLIKAIENPYTTMLGHPTGRLLLRREGYPINHKKVIDACAANFVSIEINANPRRLDMDWRWVGYALDKGVMISINPDAHEMEGYLDMHYGVHIGRKAGLTKEMTLNALSLEEIQNYFEKKKSLIGQVSK